MFVFKEKSFQNGSNRTFLKLPNISTFFGLLFLLPFIWNAFLLRKELNLVLVL